MVTFKISNVSHWEARHPLEARHDPCSRWRYLFSKYLTPTAAYRVSNTIKKKRTTVRINLCALGRLYYLYLGGDNWLCLGHLWISLGAPPALQQGCSFLLLWVVTEATATLLFLFLFGALAAVYPHQTRQCKQFSPPPPVPFQKKHNVRRPDSASRKCPSMVHFVIFFPNLWLWRSRSSMSAGLSRVVFAKIGELLQQNSDLEVQKFECRRARARKEKSHHRRRS